MQIPTKPESLNNLSIEIDQLNKAQSFLLQCQEEYKRRASFLDEEQNNRISHPKGLEDELKDLGEYFQSLQKQYIEISTQQMFLERLLEEPPFPAINLDSSEQNAEALKDEINKHVSRINNYKNHIKQLARSIENVRNSSTNVVDEVKRIMEECSAMEKEIVRVNAIVSNESKYTIEEAKELLREQTEEITKLNRNIVDKQDSIADQQWCLEDLEEEVNQLSTKAEELTKVANKLKNMDQQKNKEIEEEYIRYVEYANMCNQMYGVERIEFESNTKLQIIYAKPIEATLHIELDSTGNRIENVVITGATVPIQNLINKAKQINASEGIKMILLETLARLKRK